MESTGEYCVPLYLALEESGFDVMLAKGTLCHHSQLSS
jgi:hypothetical protein